MKTLLLAAGLVLMVSAYGQTPPPRPAPGAVARGGGVVFGRIPGFDDGPPLATSTAGRNTITVQSITEPRSSTPSNVLVVALGVQARADGLLVRRVTATTAIDDQGRSLLQENRAGANGDTSRGVIQSSLTGMVRARQAGRPTPIGGSLNLVKPPSGARAIKLLEGELEIYAPSVDNGGIARIRNFAANPGKVISDPLLAENRIELIYVTPSVHQAMPERFAWRARSPLPPPRFEDGPSIYHKDPQRVFAGLLFVDSNGDYVPAGGYQGHETADGGTLYTYRFTGRPVPENAGLEVYILVPEATLTIPFRFENVPLPH